MNDWLDEEFEPDWEYERNRMVERQIEQRGVHDKAVLRAMRSVPRHLFIPEGQRSSAYADSPQPISDGQTISQPYIVGSMTAELNLKKSSRVLEIGTGCGYQAAILAEIVRHVYTVEIIPNLLEQAKAIFAKLKYRNIKAMLGDGSVGWKEHAPFDAIIVTAASGKIPDGLIEQMAVGGTMVIPVGPKMGEQELIKLRRTKHGLERTTLYPVRFVPLVRND